jgi:hypothetical protein
MDKCYQCKSNIPGHSVRVNHGATLTIAKPWLAKRKRPGVHTATKLLHPLANLSGVILGRDPRIFLSRDNSVTGSEERFSGQARE